MIHNLSQNPSTVGNSNPNMLAEIVEEETVS